MKRKYFTKIISGILFVTIIVSGISFSFPEKAEAQTPVTDAGNIIQSSITAVNTTATSFSTYSLQLKAFVLDTLATTLAKQLIRQLTASVVNWINSGFQGSPSFITNPSSFFLDVADQVTGSFLAEAGLQSLCSPFSIDLRIALAFKYHPQIQQRYTCTLNTIIQNSSKAIAGASINGFTAGNFNQGGWPAFVSLTTEPQNNPMGAYLIADDELSIRVANTQIRQQNEINNGKGFLSWHDCSGQVTPSTQGSVTTVGTPTDNTGQSGSTPVTTPGTIAPATDTGLNNTMQGAAIAATSQQNQMMQANGASVPSSVPSVPVPANQGAINTNLSQQDQMMQSNSISNSPSVPSSTSAPAPITSDCPIKTPGDVIVSSLEANVNGPLHELQLVDSINQIVSALAAQLITQVLHNGLGSVSGSGPSDPNSYLNQVQQQSVTDTSQITSAKSSLLQNLGTYLGYTTQYQSNKNQSLGLANNAMSAYESAKSCYSSKISSAVPPLTQSEISDAQNAISAINSTENSTLTPLITQLTAGATDANSRLQTLTDLQNQINAAQTTSDLNQVSQQYSTMLQNQTLTTPQNVSDSQIELSNTINTTLPLKSDAQQKLTQCQALGEGDLNIP